MSMTQANWSMYVTDNEGNIIADADVDIRHAVSGDLVTTVQTDGEGYLSVELDPGYYRAEAAGAGGETRPFYFHVPMIINEDKKVEDFRIYMDGTIRYN